ncbi:MAG: hypothetical protein JWR14_2126 [Caballeronia sp.]|jgi:hypothetical protein|uniref:hypothetical protein n=1 Tax=Caballeronia sp. TaxID=1931223 RepID=UPI00260C54E8|nr:hypothetical protein [Caballeronia sp.]MDB5832296.1 hypothetical protein [Caballeronia sp.]
MDKLRWANCVDEPVVERATNKRSAATGGSILRGNPFGEIATDTAGFIALIMQARCNTDETFFDLDDLAPIKWPLPNDEDDMDLAMMFGVFIFGTFGAGTLLFLYKLRP